MVLRAISLFAGVGGLDLGVRIARPDARTVCYVERDAYAASALVARMADETLDRAPVWSDVQSFDAAAWRGSVDLVMAGFNCQPFSVAGKRKGTEDERWLWDDIARIVWDSGATLAFFENVPPIVRHGLPTILADLAQMGFDAEWCCLKASDVGAPHRRERWFLLAHRDDKRLQKQRGALAADQEHAAVERIGGSVADSTSGGRERRRMAQRREPDSAGAVRLFGVGLADSEEQRRSRDVEQESSVRCQPDRCGGDSSDVADTESGGPRCWTASWGSGQPSQSDERMADADCRSDADARRGSSGRDGAAQAGTGALADAGCYCENGAQHVAGASRGPSPAGRDGAGMADAPGVGHRGDRREGSGRADVDGGRPYWPPGPGERERWAAYPESAQPAICRLAPGLPDGMDPNGLRYRADRLRCMGNAVVPACAAVAFSVLWERIFGEMP